MVGYQAIRLLPYGIRAWDIYRSFDAMPQPI